jgi:hypothetical protein
LPPWHSGFNQLSLDPRSGASFSARFGAVFEPRSIAASSPAKTAQVHGSNRHTSLDYLVGKGEQFVRNGQAERLNRFEVKHQFKLSGLYI